MTVFRNCEGVTRCDSLRLGLGSLLGGGLVDALRVKGLAAHKTTTGAAAKACILIWMDGGPTHFETFDPKPDAPTEIRGEFGAISTKVPGVHFSEHMARLAASLDKFSIVRSIRHNQGNHGAGNHYMMTGAPPRIPVGCGAFVSFHPSLGSVASKELDRDNALPGYFSMPQMSRSGGPNFLGAKYAPFVVGNDPNRANFQVRDVSVPKYLHCRSQRDVLGEHEGRGGVSHVVESLSRESCCRQHRLELMGHDGARQGPPRLSSEDEIPGVAFPSRSRSQLFLDLARSMAA